MTGTQRHAQSSSVSGSGYVSERMRSAARAAAPAGPWPQQPACKMTTSDSGLREGGLAEGLFRRMGSTPAAAALLHFLVCPITKVRTA